MRKLIFQRVEFRRVSRLCLLVLVEVEVAWMDRGEELLKWEVEGYNLLEFQESGTFHQRM